MTDAASFGEWLRTRRKALDLTQGDLGRNLGLSVASIRKMENDERRPSREMVERIAEYMNVPVADRAAFAQWAGLHTRRDTRRADTPAPEPLSRAIMVSDEQPVWLRQRHLSTLPTPTTPLLGRSAEQAAVVGLLRQPNVRMVTLTGTGGTGKTRLALAVATALREQFRGGTLLVPLAVHAAARDGRSLTLDALIDEALKEAP